jgi:Pyridoxamine 5'-phosphate oxidase
MRQWPERIARRSKPSQAIQRLSCRSSTTRPRTRFPCSSGGCGSPTSGACGSHGRWRWRPLTQKSRILLLKQVTPALIFSGSYESRKGRELKVNPRAAGTLYWRETLQQITIEGPVRRLAEAESDAIFGERPADARANTVASRQGMPLDDPACPAEHGGCAAFER